MKSLEDQEFFALAKTWARQGEVHAGLIILQALMKKYPREFRVVLTYAELLEIANPLKALAFYSSVLSGEDAWLGFLANITDVERGTLFERHGLLALSLADEASALESLRKSASLGHDSLVMWAILSLLHTHYQEYNFAYKALTRSLALYHEPTLFCRLQPKDKLNINEDFFSTVGQSLLPQLSPREAEKALAELSKVFPLRPWVKELRSMIVSASESFSRTSRVAPKTSDQ